MDRDDGQASAAEGYGQTLMLSLWHLLKTMRDSADLSYAEITPLPALGRQMLVILRSGWGQTFPALCALSGKDKAQISRALRQLETIGYVTRDRPRGSLMLTGAGRALADQLTARAGARNERLLEGIDRAGITELHLVTDLLTQRANALYEEERLLAGDAAPPRDPREQYERAGADQPRLPDDALILPRLIALVAYAQRSRALAAKRLVGMPAFDTMVLSFVAARAPCPQSSLIATLSRDQSQAARTVRRLIADGLIVRNPESTRRAVLLAPTAEGLRINGVMAVEVARRNAYLGAAVSPDRLAGYRRMLATLSENAAAILSGMVRDRSGPAR
ncbi:MAG: MarR family winged helix-turn-helix transcriptional regulator [Sphingomonas fennica]